MQAEAYQLESSLNVAASSIKGPVLLVDDDPLILMGASMMLEDLGVSVFEAEGGEAALKLLADRPEISAIVTDHAMPDMTGVDLARAVRARRPDVGIVLASGYSDVNLDGLGGDGRVTQLPKPYVQEELAAALTRVI